MPPLPPAHLVRIARPIAVGRFEITRGEYARFIRETGYRTASRCFIFQGVGTDGIGIFGWSEGRSWRNPGYAQTDRHPVVCVSWVDAQAYIRWLSGKTHKAYRLLSESEWAYVTSAGAARLQWWPDDASSCRYANSADASLRRVWPTLKEGADCDDGYAFTAPVGHYRPNAFGIYDLLGNAWEWTADCAGGDFAAAPTDGSPSITGNCASRVRRSGSWYRGVDNNFSALPAGDWHGNGGFRVARDLDRQTLPSRESE